MLALTRKIGERIVIGENIVITVVDIKGENVRLSIDAPREIKIFRGEIFDAIIEENKRASVPADFTALENIKPTIPHK